MKYTVSVESNNTRKSQSMGNYEAKSEYDAIKKAQMDLVWENRKVTVPNPFKWVAREVK